MELYAIEVFGDLLVLRADGGLNTGTSSQLSDQVTTLVQGGVQKIVVDCTKLEIISSLGLSSLLMLHTRIKRVGGEVKLCGLKGAIVQVLAITKLDKVFELYPDVESARLAFRPAAKA
ncbi:MAG: STAS domain-containing protein [Phycisphaerales bacterium]|nr:STAS domain-containing protein [Phycisphaerales bacterium]